MLSKLQKSLFLVLGGFASQAMAADRPIQFPAYESAIVVSSTLSQTIGGRRAPGWGVGGEAIYSRDTFNVGNSLKYFPEGTDNPIFSVFMGSGYKRLLQLQVGYGTEDAIYRVHSELDLPVVWAFAKNASHGVFKRPGVLDYYPNNRFVVSMTWEKYDSARHLDNIAFGLGLRY